MGKERREIMQKANMSREELHKRKREEETGGIRGIVRELMEKLCKREMTERRKKIGESKYNNI